MERRSAPSLTTSGAMESPSERGTRQPRGASFPLKALSVGPSNAAISESVCLSRMGRELCTTTSSSRPPSMVFALRGRRSTTLIRTRGITTPKIYATPHRPNRKQTREKGEEKGEEKLEEKLEEKPEEMPEEMGDEERKEKGEEKGEEKLEEKEEEKGEKGEENARKRKFQEEREEKDVAEPTNRKYTRWDVTEFQLGSLCLFAISQ